MGWGWGGDEAVGWASWRRQILLGVEAAGAANTSQLIATLRHSWGLLLPFWEFGTVLQRRKALDSELVPKARGLPGQVVSSLSQDIC